MSAPWFRFYPRDYLTDSKVKMLPREYRSYLLDLWCYCGIDGSISDDVDDIASLLHEPVRKVKKAFPRIRLFFEAKDGRLYSPRLRSEAEAYEEKCQKLRTSARNGGLKKAANAIANANGECLANANPNAIANDLAKPAETETETETEKEKRSTSANAEVCAEAKKPASTPPPTPEASPDISPVVKTLPCVGSGAHEWSVTEAMLTDWGKAFPGVELVQELEKMKLWLQANPEKRKTFRGMPSFAMRWLGKAQDYARSGPKQPQARGSTPRTSRATDADAAFLAQLDALEKGA